VFSHGSSLPVQRFPEGGSKEGGGKGGIRIFVLLTKIKIVRRGERKILVRLTDVAFGRGEHWTQAFSQVKGRKKAVAKIGVGVEVET